MSGRPLRLIVILALVVSLGFSGCVLPASAGFGAPKYGFGQPPRAGYQQTYVQIPLLIPVGGLFFLVDLVILPFQAILGSGNFFPLIGTLVQVLHRIFGDKETPPEPKKTKKPPASSPTSKPTKAAAADPR